MPTTQHELYDNLMSPGPLCCDGDQCCGPGSYCCGHPDRRGTHEHEEDL